MMKNTVSLLLLSLLLVAGGVALAQPCSQLTFHDNCLSANSTSCMQFNGQCALACSIEAADGTGPQCTSNNNNCVAISAPADGNCRPKCDLMSSPASTADRCMGTPGCFSYVQSGQQQQSCITKCAGDSPSFTFDTQSSCELNPNCWWYGAQSTCLTDCSYATDPTSCSLIDSSTGNCEWDYPSQKCVVSCGSVQSGPKSVCEGASSKTGGRCAWVDPVSANDGTGGCLPKCDRAATEVDCDALSSFCIFIKDVGTTTGAGSCKLRCQYLPSAPCATMNSACKIADNGKCSLFSCSRISNRDFCYGSCQWISGLCVRSCEIYQSFAKSGGVSCDVLFKGTPMCSLDAASKQCTAAACDSLTSSGQDVCLSQRQRCNWIASSSSSSSGAKKCVPRCSSYSSFTLCGTADWCVWGTSPIDPPGKPKYCFEKCSALSSVGACSAAAQPGGCEWRYDTVLQRARCWDAPCALYCLLGGGASNDKSKCLSSSCTWTNMSSTQPSCTAPCSANTDGWSCVKAGCLWDTENCQCGLPPSMREATVSSCTCASGAGAANKCYVNSQFGICALPAAWRPSVACSTTPPPTAAPTPAPPTRAARSGNWTNASNSGNNTAAAAPSGMSTGAMVAVICSGVVLLCVVVFVLIKCREDQQDEADLILSSAPAEGTTRKKFGRPGMSNIQSGSGAAADATTLVEYTHFDETAEQGGML